MEGPENELPTSEHEAEEILQQTDLANQDEVLSAMNINEVLMCH